MQDNFLFKAIREVLTAGFIAQGYVKPDSDPAACLFPLLQAFQPTNQGVPDEPSVFIFKITDRRYGFPQKESVWNSELGEMVGTMTQLYESDFQISGLVTIKPNLGNQAGITASDLVNISAGIMQTDATLEALKDRGLSILRVREVPNPYFIDDRHRFEASPSFDFTLEHEQVIISRDPTVQIFDYNIKRV